MQYQRKLISKDRATELFPVKTIQELGRIDYVDDYSEDGKVARKIATAVAMIENSLQMQILRTQYMDEVQFERGDQLVYELEDVALIKSIDQVQKWNGTNWDTLTTDDYTVSGLTTYCIRFNTVWSTGLTYSEMVRYRVTFSAGWKDGETGDDAVNITSHQKQVLTDVVADMVACSYEGENERPLFSYNHKQALSDLFNGSGIQV